MKIAAQLIAGLWIALAATASGQLTIKDQIPDYQSLPDLTEILQAEIDKGGGIMLLGSKKDGNVYRITKTLELDLEKLGSVSIKAGLSATIIMDGPGPAFRLIGSHEGTAGPTSFKPATWNERMPIISSIEILGAHPEADGIELVQCVQPIINRVAIRWCRHGIRLAKRNRNVLISDCQIYENSGVGVYLDDCNLHQINISNSHISYNRQGGVVVRDGNVRNLHITGCDLEANMPGDETPTETANILLDVSGSPEDKSKSIAEVAITGCTIQHSANYGGKKGATMAPGGSNIRLRGKAIYLIDSVAITGNVISDTTTNLLIDHSMDVTLSGNTFFAPKPGHLTVTNSERVIVSGNTFNPRQFERPGTIHFKDSKDCVLTGNTLHQFATPDGALILENCEGFTVNGLSLTDCGSGIVLKNTRDTSIASCSARRTAEGATALSIDANSRKIRLNGNHFSGRTQIAPGAVSEK